MRLQEILLAPGVADGYSGDDLTSPRAAVLAGEVAILRPGETALGPAQAVMELRIHGVGGAPAEVNLEHPSTVQVAGDRTAGFYRSWTPGGSSEHAARREAYCWGKLNYRAASRALWLLLISFLMINVAQWALPSPWRPGDEHPRAALARTDAMCRAVLRLIGLLLTVAFIATTVTVLGDLLAWQAPSRAVLPSWLHWYGQWVLGPRLGLALLVALGAVAVLHYTSIRTAASYERWSGGTKPDQDDASPLTQVGFWNGARNVTRQRGCHVGVASSYVALIAVLPTSSHGALRTALIVVASAFIALSAGLIISPWTDRHRVVTRDRQGLADVVCTIAGVGATVLAVGVCLLRFWWVPRATTKTLPGDLIAQIIIMWTGFGLLVLLALLVLAQRPWRQSDVMGKGLAAPLLALLSWLIAGIFGAAFTLTLANIFGSPRSTFGTLSAGRSTSVLYVPTTVYSYGFGFLVTVSATALVALIALVIRSLAGRRLAAHEVGIVYDDPDPNVTGRARHAVGLLWAQARLTDYVAAALATVSLSTTAAIIAYQGIASARGGRDFPHLLFVASTIGSAIALAATGYFLVQLRAAFLDASVRRRIGLIWDVGSFWPRACHPFAPPCYAERSIPEVTARIRHVVGDIAGPDDPRPVAPPRDPAGARRLTEAHSPVLLSGYSQGSPIAVAVIAHLPCTALDQVGLLTLAAPVRRLYGRTFPAYFGPRALSVLARRLTAAPTSAADVTANIRWRNLVRRSDYIGGWVLEPIAAGAGRAGLIDHEILDPPALWPDIDPTPPPSHLHSNWFSDPQTRPAAEELIDALVTSASQAAEEPR